MELHDLVCVRGRETFGLTLCAKDIKEAMARARAMVRESGYAVHPVPKAHPETSPAIVEKPMLALAA